MAKQVKARVLVDVLIAGILYQSGKHVIECDADLAKQYVKDGALDADPGAVKYALGEGGAVLVKHATEEIRDSLLIEIETLTEALAQETDPEKREALQAQLDAKRAV